MEIVDELDTPGCPQCAVKHLCAALSYAADHNSGDEQMGEEFVLAARALINLAEADIGYKSHRDFAIGLLERAERAACLERGGATDFAMKARALRLMVASGTYTPDGALVKNAFELKARRELLSLLHPASFMWAHLEEAARELPGAFPVPIAVTTVPAIQAFLAKVRNDYFDLPPSAVPGEETQTGKEPEMATAKKTGACKGAKCAAKGGKTAKATQCACKGGKTKKGK